MGAERLDVAMASRGLAGTRSKAAALIKAGKVSVDGRECRKPATQVGRDARIEVSGDDGYVSRGAYKLVGAYDHFGPLGLPSPEGRRCLDIGASTGGFTQVLLRAGAAQVIALDVGHGQLDPLVADDPRVIEMSGTNVRDITADDLPWRPDVVVSDVSFISLTYVIPVIAAIAAPGAQIVLLVKPQFEVGKGHLGKNGIVESDDLRREALAKVTDCARGHGLTVRGHAISPIEGTHGNVEYLLWLSA